MGLIVPRSRIYHNFATERVAISALTPVSKIDSASNRPSKPPTVRKEFPETWIWENLSENGFVKKIIKILNCIICLLGACAIVQCPRNIN